MSAESPIDRTDRALRWVGACAALAATVASAGALAVHVAPEVAALGAVCGGEGLGCRGAAESAWSVLPPRVGPFTGDGWRPPVAALAVGHFALLAGWLAFVGRGGAPLRAWVGLGFAGSIGYLIVGLVALEAHCGLCLASHAANALLTAAVLARPAEARPGPRLAALACGVLFTAATWLGAGWLGSARALAVVNDQLAGLGALDELYERAWLDDGRFDADAAAEQRFDRWIRADDPQLGPPADRARGRLVLFTDLECPVCRAFERRLEREFLPLFGGELNVVYKALPLDHLHPHATTAALALEAARLQGAYERLRARLLAPGTDLGSLDWAAVAVELGLERDRFERDRGSPAAAERLDHDRRAARALGVNATPTVFLERRLVPPPARELPAFWRRLAGRPILDDRREPTPP